MRMPRAGSRLQRLCHELEQCLRRRIFRGAEVLVDPPVRRVRGTKATHRDRSLLQHRLQPLSLRRSIGMIGHMQNQERRNPLTLRHVRDS